MNTITSRFLRARFAGVLSVLAGWLPAQAVVEGIADWSRVAVVGNIAGLVKYPVTAITQAAMVLGHRAADDGGGGVFYWEPTSGRPVDGGTVFGSTVPGAPPAGRWLRLFSGPVDIDWWAPFGDGRDETALLNSAFAAAAGRGIVLREPRTYGFVPTLSIATGTRIENNGAKLLMLRDPGGANSGVLLGDGVRADLLEVEVAAGVPVRRLLSVGAENDIERLILTSRLPQAHSSSNLDGALQIRAGHVRLGEVRLAGFGYGVFAYRTHHTTIERLVVTDYINAFHARECQFIEILSAAITTPSPLASTVPGNNGLLFSGCEDVVISDTIIHDAGEHAIRIGGATDSARFVFNNIQSIRPGQCGLKINPTSGARARDIQINGLTVIDAAATSIPGSNEDGLRIEESTHVTVNGFQVQKRDRSVSAYDGIYITNSTFVTINGPKISDVASDGIHLHDLDGPVNEIFINDPTVLFAGQHGIHVDSPTQILRDITVMRGYVRGHAGWGIRVRANAATVGVNQPMILDGWVKNDGLGGVSLTTTDPDIHNHVRVIN